MSTMGALASGTYRVEGDRVIISQPGLPDVALSATVTDGKLKLGSRIDVRPPSQLATALNQASAAGTASWDRWPMPR